MKSFTLVKDVVKIEESPILAAINESINVEIKGNPDKYINKNIQIEGKDELVKELETFFREQKSETRKLVIEGLRKQNFHLKVAQQKK